MAIAEGDKVVVNFTKFGHNVVNAICKVEEVLGYFGDNTKQNVRMHVKAEQGNNTPELGMWVLVCPSEYCMPYLPPVKVGDIVKITGMMNSWAPGGVLPDQRGSLARVNKIFEKADGLATYSLRANDAPGSWGYSRESFSLDHEAPLQANLPPKPAAVKAVAKKPAIKYKCINPRKTFVSDVGVSNDLL